jgi:hypothetical protein
MVFIGQIVLKQVSELSNKVGNNEASVQMCGSKAKSFDSIWCEQPKYLGPFFGDTPSYPIGEFAGNYDWDTSSLSIDPETFAKNKETSIHAGRCSELWVV